MTKDPREALRPCPFCSQSHTLKVTTAQELAEQDADYDGEFWEHSDSFAVICDAERPDGPGGCGASGGFFPSEAEAIAAWNRRAALEAPAEQAVPRNAIENAWVAGYYHAGYTHDSAYAEQEARKYFETAPAAEQAAEPCCQEFASCQRACTPRGEWIATRAAEQAVPVAPTALQAIYHAIYGRSTAVMPIGRAQQYPDRKWLCIAFNTWEDADKARHALHELEALAERAAAHTAPEA